MVLPAAAPPNRSKSLVVILAAACAMLGRAQRLSQVLGAANGTRQAVVKALWAVSDGLLW